MDTLISDNGITGHRLDGTDWDIGDYFCSCAVLLEVLIGREPGNGKLDIGDNGISTEYMMGDFVLSGLGNAGFPIDPFTR